MNFHNVRAWHGISLESFISDLRDTAINSGAPPTVVAVLDEMLDALLDCPTADDLDDATYCGGIDMRDAVVGVLEGALPAYGLTRKQIRTILAAIEKLHPE